MYFFSFYHGQPVAFPLGFDAPALRIVIIFVVFVLFAYLVSFSPSLAICHIFFGMVSFFIFQEGGGCNPGHLITCCLRVVVTYLRTPLDHPI